MKLPHYSITAYPSEGVFSMELPYFDQGDYGPAEEVDVPDEWVWHLTSNEKINVLDENTATRKHLSRQGWLANKDRIRSAFNRSEQKDLTWAEYEAKAEAYFKRVHNTAIDETRRLVHEMQKINQFLQ